MHVSASNSPANRLRAGLSIRSRGDPSFRLTVAPNGARRTKRDHPNLPMTVPEIVDCAARCHVAGAQEIHLHVRDDAGVHSLDAGLYREAMSGIRENAPDMLIQVTTEAAGRYGVAQQRTLVEKLVPAAASISVREMLRDPSHAQATYAFAQEAGIDVQHILYDTGDLEQLRNWIADGVVSSQMRRVLLVLGQYAPARHARPSDVAPFVKVLRDEFTDWTACAFGPQEQATLLTARSLGGHVRIGFENNLHRPDGTLAHDNAEQIARFVAAQNEQPANNPH